jgi:1-acyl-sn-glycerol-3-phosphate acyltransferase
MFLCSLYIVCFAFLIVVTSGCNCGQRGAFSVATKTGAPVIPITLIGTGELMPSGMEGTLNSGSVKVIIHQPIQGKDAEALCCEARNVIADAVLRHGYGVH